MGLVRSSGEVLAVNRDRKGWGGDIPSLDLWLVVTLDLLGGKVLQAHGSCLWVDARGGGISQGSVPVSVDRMASKYVLSVAAWDKQGMVLEGGGRMWCRKYHGKRNRFENGKQVIKRSITIVGLSFEGSDCCPPRFKVLCWKKLREKTPYIRYYYIQVLPLFRVLGELVFTTSPRLC